MEVTFDEMLHQNRVGICTPAQHPFLIGMMCKDVNTIFANALKWVIDSPYSDFGRDVRPKWDDGTPAHTHKAHHYVALYTHVAAPESFPLLGLRKTYWRGAYDEILWIYQKASNRLEDLNSHIWDEWDVGDFTIGKAYGYQIAKKTQYKEGLFNQMEKVIYDLRHNPTSRSIMTNTYCIEDLPEMGLRPCAYSMTYNVRFSNDGTPILDGILNQRSWDMVTAGGWNIAQYAILLAMVAHVCDMQCGDLLHVVADAHVYDRHVGIAKQMIANLDGLPRYEGHDGPPHHLQNTLNPGSTVHYDGSVIMPTLGIDPSVKEFSDFKPDSITIKGYNCAEYSPKIPVAV